MKYYAVKNGRRPGIYTNWNMCKEQVLGYQGAIYKKFETKREAEAFISDESSSTSTNTTKTNLMQVEDLKAEEGLVYVDGSFRSTDNSYSYGYIILTKTQVFEASKRFFDERFSIFRNVAGEIIGSQEAINKAIELKLKKIYLHHDYAGIRHWALKEWRANNELTKTYRDFFKDKSQDIDVEFIKVESHTGIKYNELVDQLAKDAK